MGWSFTWHHYGIQPDSDRCGFRVVMLAMQWCHTNRLTGQLPRWFLTYCASVLQLFAYDTSSLRSTVNTFQDWAYEDALREYDEPVDWATTEAGPLPAVTNSDVEATLHNHQYMASSLSNSAGGMSSASNDSLPPHPSTRKKCGTSKGTTGATPQTTPPPTTPIPRIPTSRKANMPPRTRTTGTTGHTVNHLPKVDKRATQLLGTTPQRSGHPTPSPGRAPRRPVHSTTKSLILDARDQL